MVKTLELAMSKAAALPDAAQEKIGRDLLDRIDALNRLRAEVDIGIRELDAGQGRPLDIEDVIKQARDEHAGKSRELIWAPTARRDLLDIWHYFTNVASSEVAERLLHDIDVTAARLLRHPLSGRPREDLAPMLRSVLVQPYAILYRVTEADIEVARVPPHAT